MELLLDGKLVSASIKSRFEEKLRLLEKKPNLVVLTLNPNDANLSYIRKIDSSYCYTRGQTWYHNYDMFFSLPIIRNVV